MLVEGTGYYREGRTEDLRQTLAMRHDGHGHASAATNSKANHSRPRESRAAMQHGDGSSAVSSNIRTSLNKPNASQPDDGWKVAKRGRASKAQVKVQAEPNNPCARGGCVASDTGSRFDALQEHSEGQITENVEDYYIRDCQ